MDHNFIHRFPKLFPSAFSLCHPHYEPDIVHISPPITKTTQKPFSRIHSNSHLNQIMKSKPTKNDRNMSHVDQRIHKDSKELKMKNSSSSYSGLFSSEENETFCSFSTAENKSSNGRCLSEVSVRSIGSMGRCSSEVSVRSIGSMRRCSSEVSVRSMRSIGSMGRCSSEVSVRSIGSILSELTHKSQTVEENCYENRAFSKKVAKPNDMFETQDWQLQDASNVPGIPAELYYKQSKKHGNSTNPCRRNRRMKQRKSRGGRRGENGDIGFCSIVEKTSNDPYRDFRTSIVEMIMENQIFGGHDLEKLLHYLLSLNSPYYHDVIVQVFSEIWQTLYSE